MPDEDLVFYTLKQAGEMGASYAEARLHSHDTRHILIRNGTVIGVERSISKGLGLRVIVDGALGYASTNKLTRESLHNLAERAIRIARSSSRLIRKPIEFSEARLGRVDYRVSPAKPLDSLGIDEKIKRLQDYWSIVNNSVHKAKIPVFFLMYNEDVEEKIVATSDSGYIHSVIPRIGLFYNIVVMDPGRGSIQRWRQLGASGGLEWLDKFSLEEELRREVGVYERILYEAVSPPRDRVDVVVGSEIVGLIVHESCGHPSEADRILGREAAQAGKSFIKPGMIGERIGSEHVTVVDDPTIPGGYGYYLYDDEAVPARPKYLYHRGLINEHLHNRWTAKIYGVESNGSARAMDYRSEPIIRMSNTYFKPGDHSFEELIEDIRHGVYIKSYMEWNIDDERWSQRYIGLEAYLIEGGELKQLIRNPVLEITTKSFYSAIDAVGKDLRFYAGTCGKGEPAQGVPVWLGGPDVRLRNIRLGVAPK